MDDLVVNAILTYIDGVKPYPVFWPDIEYSTEDKPDTFLQVTLIPVASNTLGLNTLEQHLALLQISILTIKGQGLVKISAMAREILDLFPRNTELLTSDSRKIRFDRVGFIGPSFIDPSDRQVIPVRFEFNLIT